LETKKIIQVDEKVPANLLFPLSLQHMFAMFGASVLVPILFNINPSVVLLMNGVGTLIFILITKGKAPAYLGSSFAFLAPAGLVIGKWGYRDALGGFIAVGLLLCLLSLIVYLFGVKWIDIVLPAAAMGPVVALIGLELAGSAAQTGGIVATADSPIKMANVIVFLVTLVVAVLGNVLFRKFFAVIPILIAILAGYITALITGVVTTSMLSKAVHTSFFVIPNFQTPHFNFQAIVMIIPVILVLASEHIGHQLVTSKIVGHDLIKDPGLHRSLLADGISTTLSGFVGSVPTTTYGENIGVMAITKVYSVQVIGGAAVISILSAFIGPVAALIQTIPGPVIGGISFLLYGMIGASGIRVITDAQVDYSKSQNLILTSIVFVTGLSGVALNIQEVTLKGMVLACIVGMALSLLFHIFNKLGWSNEQ
jgi:uracil permease